MCDRQRVLFHRLGRTEETVANRRQKLENLLILLFAFGHIAGWAHWKNANLTWRKLSARRKDKDKPGINFWMACLWDCRTTGFYKVTALASMAANQQERKRKSSAIDGIFQRGTYRTTAGIAKDGYLCSVCQTVVWDARTLSGHRSSIACIPLVSAAASQNAAEAAAMGDQATAMEVDLGHEQGVGATPLGLELLGATALNTDEGLLVPSSVPSSAPLALPNFHPFRLKESMLLQSCC